MVESSKAMNILKSKRPAPSVVALYVCLTVLVIFFVVPILGVGLSSLKTTQQVAMGNLWKLEGKLTLQNYIDIFLESNLKQYLINRSSTETRSIFEHKLRGIG